MYAKIYIVHRCQCCIVMTSVQSNLANGSIAAAHTLRPSLIAAGFDPMGAKSSSHKVAEVSGKICTQSTASLGSSGRPTCTSLPPQAESRSVHCFVRPTRVPIT